MQQRKWKTMPSRIRGNNCTKQAIVNAMLHPQDLSWGLNDSLQLLGVLPVYTPHQELPLAENGCFFQSHAASIQWLTDVRSECLIPSSPLWKAIPAPELWPNFLSHCLECITNQLLPLPSSASFPFPKSVDPESTPQKTPSMLISTSESLSGQPNHKPKRYKTLPWSFTVKKLWY